METKKLKWVKLIPYITIVLLGAGLFYYVNKASNFKDKYQQELKLSKALLDTVTQYKNTNGELVAEKRTIQAKVENLEAMNEYLTKSQKELVERVKQIEKNNSIIAAALIETKVLINNIRDGLVVVDTASGRIDISDSLPEIEYDFTLFKAKPKFTDQPPIFKINNIYLPNKQFVEFHWKDNKKEGYPVSFSVSNSNKYFSTANLESYVIPELQKENVDPNWWQRLNKKLKGGEKIILGGVIGAGATLLLMR